MSHQVSNQGQFGTTNGSLGDPTAPHVPVPIDENEMQDIEETQRPKIGQKRMGEEQEQERTAVRARLELMVSAVHEDSQDVWMPGGGFPIAHDAGAVEWNTIMEETMRTPEVDPNAKDFDPILVKKAKKQEYDKLRERRT